MTNLTGEKCTWKNCKKDIAWEFIYHHHGGDPCEIDYADGRHHIFGLCEKHARKAENDYAHQFIGPVKE